MAVDRYGEPLPPGAVGRLGSIRPPGGARDMVFLPDGLAGPSFIHDMTLSPDGRFLALGETKSVGIWELGTGEQIGQLGTPTEIVVFSPDGKTLASAGFDEALRVWDVEKAKAIWSLEAQEWVKALAFSPDGQFLASGDNANKGPRSRWSWPKASMFTLRVRCKCGFVSEEGIWRVRSLFDQGQIGIPVYLPRDGRLLTHWFNSQDVGVLPEELDSWITKNGHACVARNYGDDAVMLSPPASDEQAVHCPKCGCDDGKVEIVGIH